MYHFYPCVIQKFDHPIMSLWMICSETQFRNDLFSTSIQTLFDTCKILSRGIIMKRQQTLLISQMLSKILQLPHVIYERIIRYLAIYFAPTYMSTIKTIGFGAIGFILTLNEEKRGSDIYANIYKAKSRKYRGMFEVHSPENNDKFGKRIGLNR